MDAEALNVILTRFNFGELILLVLLVGGAAIYVLRHIKWNKQGKPYWHSSLIEYQKDQLKPLIQKLDDHIKLDGEVNAEIMKHFKTLDMEVWKQTVFMEGAPIREKLWSGLRYIKAGGNSDTKAEVQRLIAENAEIYTAIIMVQPELTV